MVKSYFEYTLEQCSESVIPAVCSLFKTKTELLEAATKGFNGNDHILGQGLLIHAAIEFISEKGYIDSSELDRDARKIYARCERNLEEMNQKNRHHNDIDREELFNVLVDLNWLFSSKYMHIQRKESGVIALLTSPHTIRVAFRKGSTDLIYESALYDKDRCEQYGTAQLTRYHLLPSSHPDSEVRNLFTQGYRCSDFKQLQVQAQECGIRRMALFYGLTATAAKAEQIRRM